MKKYILLCSIPIVTFGMILYNCIDHRPLVSVVMPTYNRLALLPKSIDSILSQTYDKFEFIIVDDGSTDGSNNLLQAYAQLDSRIKILTNEQNRGISYSRNRGTDAAKGKYVAIMDSDDVSLPERLEKHVNYLEKNKDVVALNALYLEMGKEANGTNNWVPPNRFEIIFHLKNYFTNISFFRTDFVRKHNIRYNENMMSSEDYDFWSQIFLNGGKLHMLNEHLINLRRHRTNSKEYYQQIKSNARIVSNRLLKAFGVPNPEQLKSQCEQLNAMVQANKKTKRVDQYTLELTFNRSCNKKTTPKNGFYVKHVDFVDYLHPTEKKNVFKRQRNGDKYILKSQKGLFYTFITPNGAEEVYNRQNDGALALKSSTNDTDNFFIRCYKKIKSYFQ